jgi:hypothetical protein
LEQLGLFNSWSKITWNYLWVKNLKNRDIPGLWEQLALLAFQEGVRIGRWESIHWQSRLQALPIQRQKPEIPRAV